jgi:DNA polymerase III subunit epsilon
MREIIFDTETTGLSPREGHRVVEIGCVEMENRFLTGRTFHAYLNPERDMPVEAFNVHGLSAEFLADKPVFAKVAAELVAFLGDATLVAHNASFDVTFLNAEFAACGLPAIAPDRVVDTLVLARKRHPGQRNDLDSLCQRYGIDNSRRTKHGALMDSEFLSEVYVELMGGRQATLGLAATPVAEAGKATAATRRRPAPLNRAIAAEELAAHRAFVETLGEKAFWRAYLGQDGTGQ